VRCRLGVEKNAQVVEAHLGDEIGQGLEVRLGLAGKTRHDGGAERRPGKSLTDAPHRVQNILAPRAPPHAPQHLVMAVLDGDIQVGENPGVGGHDGQEFRGDAGRVAVEEAIQRKPSMAATSRSSAAIPGCPGTSSP
jgi:hypothetical protein